MSKPFRWNRRRYRKAHHLARLMSRLDYYAEPPRIVERYRDLWEKHPMGRDPLEEPIDWRLGRFRGDDIPF